MDTSHTSGQAEQAHNLRQLADLLDHAPNLPSMPYIGSGGRSVDASWYLTIDTDNETEQKQAARDIIRAFRGTWDRKNSDRDGGLTTWTQQIGGVLLRVQVSRSAVCERVVTGTRTVTREVPDPDAPTITETVEVEDVEWRCGSLLADDDLETAVA